MPLEIGFADVMGQIETLDIELSKEM